MGPHSFKCGKSGLDNAVANPGRLLQWGRTLSSAERRETISCLAMWRCASMGPHSFKCGKDGERFQGVHDPAAFNGAALFQVRKAKAGLKKRPEERSLQWGRTLSSAESFANHAHSWQISYPSMGPHSFKCGKPLRSAGAKNVAPTFNGAALFQVRKARGKYDRAKAGLNLQWGRTLSSAERDIVLSHHDAKPKPFNGAALFQVRKENLPGRAGYYMDAPSMGPHSFKCGKSMRGSAGNTRAETFNGAALFQVRKGLCGWLMRWPFQCLQWGRTLSSAERALKDSAKRKTKAAFNGAALFQVRKVAKHAPEVEKDLTFNGAALFQVRKGGGAVFILGAVNVLQWGRTLSSAESTVRRSSVTSLPPLQWGRTLSSAESSRANWMMQDSLPLQWGRTLSSAERVTS